MTAVENLLAGRYELGRRLGAGTVGEVYQGYDHQLDRPFLAPVSHEETSGVIDVLSP